MVEFEREMPIEFSGIRDEHLSNGAGFDVSHMGEIWVKGPQALALLEYAGSRSFVAGSRAGSILLFP